MNPLLICTSATSHGGSWRNHGSHALIRCYGAGEPTRRGRYLSLRLLRRAS